MSKAGKRLLMAAREMRAIARGEAKPAHVHVPPDVGGGSMTELKGRALATADDLAPAHICPQALNSVR